MGWRNLDLRLLVDFTCRTLMHVACAHNHVPLVFASRNLSQRCVDLGADPAPTGVSFPSTFTCLFVCGLVIQDVGRLADASRRLSSPLSLAPKYLTSPPTQYGPLSFGSPPPLNKTPARSCRVYIWYNLTHILIHEIGMGLQHTAPPGLQAAAPHLLSSYNLYHLKTTSRK